MVSLPGVTFSRKEGEILGKVLDIVKTTREAEQQLPQLVAAAAQGDERSCAVSRDKIFELEAEAADTKRELSTQIAEGAFFGGTREDMLALLDKVWKIADNAKDAARLITLAEITDPNAQGILRSDEMKGFLESLDRCVAAVSYLIEALEINKKTALSRMHAVGEAERAADTFKQAILASLFDRSKGIDPVTVIMVRDFVFSADDVADYAEHASDVVLVLIAKGYG